MDIPVTRKLKTVLYLVLAISLLHIGFFDSAALCADFEGVFYVSMLSASEDSSMDIKYFVKSQKLRMENRVSRFSEITNIMLIDYGTGKMYTLMPENKQYIEYALPSDESRGFDMPDNGVEKDITKPVKTGKTEPMHGYTCEQWILKEGDGMEIEIWMARGIPPIRGIGGKLPFGTEDMMPFKVITRMDSGEEVSRMEVTAVSKKPLDDELFKLPAGYKKISLQDSFPMPGR